MKKILKSTVSLITAFSMILTITVFALVPEDFSDFPNDWSTQAMTSAVANGLLTGRGEGLIAPLDNLTRAEMATIINRVFGAAKKADISSIKDVSKSDWFYDEIAKAVNMQTFIGSGDGFMLPNNFITRQEVFCVIARAFVLTNKSLSSLDKFSDKSDIAPWALESTAAMVESGYLSGNGMGMLNPKAYITRAEFAQVIHNIVKQYLPVISVISNVTSNTSVIKSPFQRIDNTTINGDLIIGDGVDLSAIIFTNVKITGRLVIRGAANITFNNVQIGKGIFINNVNNTVEFNHRGNENLFADVTELTSVKYIGGGGVTIKPGGGSGGGTTKPVERYADYTIKHYKQNKNLNGYDVVSEIKNGRVGANVTASVKFYNGFTYNKAISTESGVVLADDSLVLSLYYDRNEYTVTLDAQDGTVTPSSIKAAYDTAVGTLPIPEKEGYTFDGWFTKVNGGGTKVTSTYVVTKNLTIYADWTLIPGEEEAKFTVKHYKQNLTLDGYDEVEADEQILDGVIGTTVNATAKTYEGFTYNQAISTESGVVLADDSLVLSLYYDRNLYTVTFKHIASGTNEIFTIPWGGTVNSSSVPNVYQYGYWEGPTLEWDGTSYRHEIKQHRWYDNSKDVEFTNDLVITENLTFTPNWKRLSAFIELNYSGVSSDVNPVVSYDSSERALEAIKDMVFTNKNVVLNAISEIEEKALEKAVEKGVLDFNRNILKQSKTIKVTEVIEQQELTDKLVEKVPAQTEAVDEIVGQLVSENAITVTEENSEVVEALKEVLEEVTFDKVEQYIPQAYKDIMSESELEDLFERARNDYINLINEALNALGILNPGSELNIASGVTTIVSYITIYVNPVTELMIPKYNEVIDKIEEYEDIYADNQAFLDLLNLITPENLLSGEASEESEQVLSGYRLLSNEEYYELLKQIVVLSDKAIQKFNEDYENGTITDIKLANFIDDGIDAFLDYYNIVKDSNYLGFILDDFDLNPASLKDKAYKVINNYDITVDELFTKFAGGNDTYVKEYKGNTVTFIRKIQ